MVQFGLLLLEHDKDGARANTGRRRTSRAAGISGRHDCAHDHHGALGRGFGSLLSWVPDGSVCRFLSGGRCTGRPSNFSDLLRLGTALRPRSTMLELPGQAAHWRTL